DLSAGPAALRRRPADLSVPAGPGVLAGRLPRPEPLARRLLRRGPRPARGRGTRHGGRYRHHGAGDHLAARARSIRWDHAVQRDPGLPLIFTEQRADWLRPTLADLDAQYERAMFRHLRQTLPLKPSEYFRRNGYVGASFMNDGEWQTRYQLGVDRLMWGSDYP